MAITHIVAFKFPASADAADVEGFLARFLALKDTCKRDGKTYIQSITGGPNVSIEMDKGYNFAVVVQFATTADRDYYVKQDETHAAFATDVKAAIEDAFIFDYES